MASCPTARAARGATEGQRPRRARHPRRPGRQGAAPGRAAPRRPTAGSRPARAAAAAGRTRCERLAALHPDAPVLADDAALVAALRPALGARISLTARAFDDDDRRRRSRRWPSRSATCPAGCGSASSPRPALTAIDVDLGAAARGARRPRRRRIWTRNRAALPALARQIRLRNLSGAILVDLAGLSPRRRAALGAGVRRGTRGRSAAPALARLHRAGPGGNPAPARASAAARTARRPARRRAGGAASLCAREVAARPGRRPVLAAAPAVADALRA